jgi:hypothetical protein
VGGSAPLYKKEDKEDKKQVAKFPEVGYPRTGKLAGPRKLVPKALGSGGRWPGYRPPRSRALVATGQDTGHQGPGPWSTGAGRPAGHLS